MAAAGSGGGGSSAAVPLTELPSVFNGAGIMVWYQERSKADEVHVLIGKESNFLDEVKAGTPREETFIGTPDAANAHFSARAKALSSMHGITVHYSQLVPNAEKTGFTTVYRALKGTAKYGVPKGHREGAENALKTAARELNEETGVTLLRTHELKRPHLVEENYVMFHCQIHPSEKAVFEAAIASCYARNYGEMFDLSFLELSAVIYLIETDSSLFNKKSRQALEYLNSLEKGSVLRSALPPSHAHNALRPLGTGAVSTAAGGGFVGNGSVPIPAATSVSAATAGGGGASRSLKLTTGEYVPERGWRRTRAANGKIMYSHPSTSISFKEESLAGSNRETRVDGWTIGFSASRPDAMAFGKPPEGSASGARFYATRSTRRKVSRNVRRKQRRSNTKKHRRT